MERRWTPLSKAMERGFEAVAGVIRGCIGKTSVTPLAVMGHSNGELYDSDAKYGSNVDQFDHKHGGSDKKHDRHKYNNHMVKKDRGNRTKSGQSDSKEQGGVGQVSVGTLIVNDVQGSPGSNDIQGSASRGTPEALPSRGKSAPSHSRSRNHHLPPQQQPPTEMLVAASETSPRPSSRDRPGSAHHSQLSGANHAESQFGDGSVIPEVQVFDDETEEEELVQVVNLDGPLDLDNVDPPPSNPPSDTYYK